MPETDVSQLLQTLKRQLKCQGRTYRDLARALRVSEPTVKRLFSSGRMTLDRLSQVAGFLGFTLAELMAEAQSTQPRLEHLTREQESTLVATPELLLVAACALNHWSLEQMTTAYRLRKVDALRYLLQLDRMGILDLLPNNRIRLKIHRDFDWIPDGPIRRFFRDHCERDFLKDAFGGPEDVFGFHHGMLGETARAELRVELERLRQKFSQWHQDSTTLPLGRRRGIGFWMAVREWEPELFRRLRRAEPQP